MCQTIKDGGKRCPIHRHASIASIILVTEKTGLERAQVEHIFQEVRKEARDNDAEVTAKFRDLFLASELRRVTDANVAARCKKHIDAAAETESDLDDPITRFAQTRLRIRAAERKTALEEKFAEIAERTGYTVPEVTNLFKAAYADVPSTATMPAHIRESAAAVGLPSDSATLIALSNITTPAQTTDRITHVLAPKNSSILSYGYDEGRLEVVYKKQPDQKQAYKNVPASLWTKIQQAKRPSQVISLNIAGRPEHQYESAQAAAADAGSVQCASCGQFAASTHTCPQKERRTLLTHAGTTSEHIPRNIYSNTAETPIADRDGLPEPLAGRYDVTVKKAEDGNEYISFSEKNMTELEELALMERMPIPVPIQPSPLYMSNDELQQGILLAEAVDRADTTHLPSNLAGVRLALDEKDVEFPISVEFSPTFYPGWANRGQVTGAFLFHSTDFTGERPVIKSHTLRCSCPDYEEYYQCVHVTATEALGPHLPYSDEDPVPGVLEPFDDSPYNMDGNFNEYEMQEELIARRNAVRQGEAEWDTVALHRQTEGRQEAEEQAAARAADARAHKEKNERIDTDARRKAKEHIIDIDNARTAMVERWQTREHRYAGNPEQAFADYQAARRARKHGEGLSYATDGVLDGGSDAAHAGSRGFGVELEFDFPESMDDTEKAAAMQAIGEALYAEEYTRLPDVENYHTGTNTGWGSWTFEEDDTVTGEVVSPVLYDRPEDWKALQRVCEIVKQHGGVMSSRTGSHVNISSGSYENSAAKHLELARSVSQNMDLLYRLSTAPSRGKHRGMEWCKPNVVIARSSVLLEASPGKTWEESWEESKKRIGVTRFGHGALVNFNHSGKSDPTDSRIEYRMWDGTLDPAVIQRQVMLSMALTDYAERRVVAHGASLQPELTVKPEVGQMRSQEAEHLDAAGRSTHDQDSFWETNGTAVEFIEQLFRREEDQKRIMELFSITSWPQRIPPKE